MEAPSDNQEIIPMDSGIVAVQVDFLPILLQFMSLSQNTTITVIERMEPVSILEVIISVVYSLLFFIGLISNVWVSAVIITVLWCRKGGRLTNILIYILALAILNIFITLSMPVAVADMITGYWPLSNPFCSIYWILEMLNKTMASLIITLLTIACYFAVCRPQMQVMYKNYICALIQLAMAFGLISWKTYSIFYYYDVYYIVQNSSTNDTLVQMGKKCLLQLMHDENAETFFAMSAFTIGYLLPILVIFLCYTAILRRVYFVRRRQSGAAEILERDQTTCTRANQRFCRTAKSVAILIFFHLSTWTPYWCVTVPIYVHKQEAAQNQNGQAAQEFTSMVIALISHLTPFVNCAFAPLLYTWSNRQIKGLCRRHDNRIRVNTGGWYERCCCM